MKNYVDIKTVIWQRTWFDNDTNMDEIVDLCREGNVGDIYSNWHFVENEMLYDTEDRLTPKDNNGSPTIEVYEQDKLIWENS